MSQEYRIDSYRIDGRRVRRDARGFAVVPSRLTRTGILLYQRADGKTVRELRPPEAVFAPEHLASIEAAPVTIGHPGGGLVDATPHNVRELEVGIVASAARRDGNFVAAELSIRDAAAIAKVERGELVELSLSYSVGHVDPTPGVYEGERYDAVQRGPLRVNHVALLPSGGGRAACSRSAPGRCPRRPRTSAFSGRGLSPGSARCQRTRSASAT